MRSQEERGDRNPELGKRHPISAYRRCAQRLMRSDSKAIVNGVNQVATGKDIEIGTNFTLNQTLLPYLREH